MPELPEVETVCEGLRRDILGASIQDVQLNRKDLRIPFPRNLNKQLMGRRIDSITRRAKYILIHLNDAQVVALHLGMSGRILVVKTKDYEQQAHDHMVWRLKGDKLFIFNDARRFGMVFLMDADDLETHKAFSHLGPEPLGNEFSAPVLLQKLKGRKSAIKQAIMDQRIVVGVGNIYACEALHRSGIHPETKAGQVKGERAEKLVKEIRNVLDKAIKAGGSSLKDYVQSNGELGYFQHSFSVYDREGQACPACDCNIDKTGGVQRIVQGGRSTFFCKTKQTKR